MTTALEVVKQETILPYGFHEKMPFVEYAKIPALNYSSLKHMKRSPLSYRYHCDNPTPPTDEMLLGTACHTAMLEPDKTGDFAVWRGGVRRSKAWDAFQKANRHKQILTVAEYEKVVGMSVAIRKSPLAMKYVRSGRSEVSIVWRDKASGRDCKGRLDMLPDSPTPLIVDLKTCRDCSPIRFGNEAYRLGYHIQLAMYRDGYYYLTGKLPKMKEIAVESKAPYEIAVFDVPDDVIEQGKDDYSRLIVQLTKCEEENHWPPALETETQLSLPSYAYGYDSDDLSGLELVAS